MRRLLGLIVISAVITSHLLVLSTHAQGSGAVSGVVSGPSGPVAGATVNVINSAGMVVGSAVTTSAGTYSIGNLAVGTYMVQVVGSTGAVVVTGTAAVTATAAAATVNLSLTAGQLAAAGVAAGAAVSTGMATSTKAILAVAAIAGGGVIATVALKDDPSPNR